MEEKFESFLSNYFGANYDKKNSEEREDAIITIQFYFKNSNVWSSLYCSMTWNDSTLENDADLEVFDLLLKIDIQNGADTSKIVLFLCGYGAFEAVKVRKSYFPFHRFLRLFILLFKIRMINIYL